MLSSLGLLTHGFFRIRKKHARCFFENCIGRFTIDFESTFFALFSILLNQHSDVCGVRLIRKCWICIFLETVVRASILFLLVLFYCLPVSLSLFLSVPLSLCVCLCLCPSLSLSLCHSLSLSLGRLRAPAAHGVSSLWF